MLSFLWSLRLYLLALLFSCTLGWICVQEIIARAGEPALPLDDAFIHLQYARRLAYGHFFSYSPGDGYSSGATSLLWPTALSLFFWLGVDGLAAVWAAWALGTIFHAATMVEAGRVAAGLTGRNGGLAAAGACGVFGGFAWFAWSGMETIALAWVLMATVRVAAECCEAKDGGGGSARLLVLLGLIGPLVRPEGALASLIAALALWRSRGLRREGKLCPRRLATTVTPLLGPFIIPTLHWAFAGHATSSTAMVKWLPMDPYSTTADWVGATLDNVHLLLTDLLAGGGWTVLFMPKHLVLPLWPGVLAMFWLAYKKGRLARAMFVSLVLLGTMIPCTFSTMLWNRVRYIWPFAPSWFIPIVCLCCLCGQIAGLARFARWRRFRWRLASTALLLVFIALLTTKLPDAVDDLAQSARAIALQQVKLGKWAAQTLPRDAVIGVNDTGAVAYLSGRRTFDIVGLTTEGEARYWSAGSGPRFEHYERLGAARLPTHFVVYRHWMAVPALLGRRLEKATVIHQSILGGHTMGAYEARTELLGSGEQPDRAPGEPPHGALLDRLDVADLESEKEHRYVLRGTRSGNTVAEQAWQPGRRDRAADGGRINRLEDRFFIRHVDQPSIMVMRVATDKPLQVWIDGAQVAVVQPVQQNDLIVQRWQERTVRLPGPPQGDPNPAERFVVVRSDERGSRFSSFHYWWFAER